MRVTNLQSWAGENFSYLPGEVIDLPKAIATARIKAGLASPIQAAVGKIPSQQQPALEGMNEPEATQEAAVDGANEPDGSN
ncbi:MAG: hypothetical protein QM757_16545 [Paludibaculum sp.]